ncbi:MAG: exosortase K [Methylomonas sp.]|nr:MAG: exosortase K [Methylomonas sp.]
MFANNLPLRAKQLGYWLCVAIMLVALKQFYSAATAAQLQWQLYPLVITLEALSDLLFEPTANGEWLDPIHHISLVKACAGINFLIISLLGYCWLWRDRPMPLWVLMRALVLAWLTALLANSLRILLCIYAQAPLAMLISSTEAASHRLIGIAVYFSCLWIQLSAFDVQRFRQMAVTAALIYLSVTVLMPVFRAYLLGSALPNVQHLFWVIGFPVFVLVMLTSLQYRSP